MGGTVDVHGGRGCSYKECGERPALNGCVLSWFVVSQGKGGVRTSVFHRPNENESVAGKTPALPGSTWTAQLRRAGLEASTSVGRERQSAS